MAIGGSRKIDLRHRLHGRRVGDDGVAGFDAARRGAQSPGRSFREHDAAGSCTVNTVSVEGRPRNSVYKIDAGLESTDELEQAIEETFRDSSGKSLLLSYAMDFADVKQVVAPSRSATTSPDAAAAKPPAKAGGGTSTGGNTGCQDRRRSPPRRRTPAHRRRATAPAAAPEPKPDVPADSGTKGGERPDGQGGPGQPRVVAAPGPAARYVAGLGRACASAAQDDATGPAGHRRRRPPPSPRRSRPHPRRTKPAADAPAPTVPATPQPAADGGTKPGDEAADEGSARKFAPSRRLTFGDAINAPTLRDNLKMAYNEVHPAAVKVAQTADAAATALATTCRACSSIRTRF